MGQTRLASTDRNPDTDEADTLSVPKTDLAVHPFIEQLPPEILAQAFEVYAAEADIAPITLSRVCKYWRDVVSSWPCIWQRISLDESSRSVESLRKQAELWVIRSDPLAFDVEVNIESGNNLLPLLAPFFQHVKRWRTCKIRGKWEEDISIPLLFEGMERFMPHCVNQVEVTVEDDETDESSINPPTTPTLREWGGSLVMHVTVTALPQPHLIAPVPIDTLIFHEITLDLATHPLELLTFLTAFPELQSLNIESWAQETERLENDAPMVFLPQLRVLQLKSTCSTRLILSHLHAPSLKQLYLEHLNVDFRINPETFSESGDSEDEAHDFSQSPWSDHATGMGLRSLIKRCNPPLNLLQMDYADMRTKDFIWCFNRLTSLRVFRIVASDMSDKVIDLLAPYPKKEPADSDGEDVDSKTLRLPQLQELELYNCQRLSGDAVVEALQERVTFSGRKDRHDGFASLNRVVIVGCQDFRHHHGRALGKVLGSRLRTS
ncbi:hypothetical protein JAAARDRAFT_149247 [Jaapia argillacea MUCL 33604]|uniref:F-box domain-containing protein n=1 Tax=Jaapia argillacea MUCL 33604 TaxID=933084 RepID=A0A067QFV1_9AGAM|nr:hypothetical protein JAAARDRAFT_149247 [Jaapia argillacea MUCL 33604]